MAELVIFGASDDLVEVEGVVREEFPVPADTEEVTLLVVCPDGRQAKVRAKYETGGVWSVTFMPVEEDCPAPEGKVDVTGYTARLTLEVPDKTTVHRTAR